MALITVKNLSKIYAQDGTQTPALDGVSFTVEAGEFIAIMGPSGSGKSTLLHLLGFLDHPTSGSCQFMGKTMDSYPPTAVAQIRNQHMGFVFQAFNLLPRTTVFDNVKLPLLYSRLPESEWQERVSAVIAAVGLQHRVDAPGAQLSGGERQRVAIARALVNRPSVIFADEPTGNLDTKTGATILALLTQLNRQGGHTIIIITHDESIARQARRIISLRDGRLVGDRAAVGAGPTAVVTPGPDFYAP